jgi:hypothetical protein
MHRKSGRASVVENRSSFSSLSRPLPWEALNDQAQRIARLCLFLDAKTSKEGFARHLFNSSRQVAKEAHPFGPAVDVKDDAF